jgi:hypothetical protein
MKELLKTLEARFMYLMEQTRQEQTTSAMLVIKAKITEVRSLMQQVKAMKDDV